MGIGSITSANSMSVMQMPSTDLKDHKSKNIQNEITDVQQKIQKLSSEEELSANEKADERKKLQKEKSSLDTELKQHQEELLRSQKREAMLAELREAQNPLKGKTDKDEMQEAETSSAVSEEEKTAAGEQPAQPMQPGTVISQSSDGTVILKEVLNPAADNTDSAQTKPADETRESAAAEETKPEEEETDTDPAAEFRPTAQEMQAMVSSAASMQIADRMGTLVTKTDDGMAVLKGEIKQDEYRGTNTDRKQAEFEDMQQQKNREMEFQFSMLGEAGNTMKTAADKESDTNALQTDTGKHFQVSGLNVPQDEQAAQQGFQVSIA